MHGQTGVKKSYGTIKSDVINEIIRSMTDSGQLLHTHQSSLNAHVCVWKCVLVCVFIQFFSSSFTSQMRVFCTASILRPIKITFFMLLCILRMEFETLEFHGCCNYWLFDSMVRLKVCQFTFLNVPHVLHSDKASTVFLIGQLICSLRELMAFYPPVPHLRCKPANPSCMKGRWWSLGPA